jgi:hypothetical protein
MSTFCALGTVEVPPLPVHAVNTGKKEGNGGGGDLERRRWPRPTVPERASTRACVRGRRCQQAESAAALRRSAQTTLRSNRAVRRVRAEAAACGEEIVAVGLSGRWRADLKFWRGRSERSDENLEPRMRCPNFSLALATCRSVLCEVTQKRLSNWQSSSSPISAFPKSTLSRPHCLSFALRSVARSLSLRLASFSVQ